MVMFAKTPKIKQRTASDLKERNGGRGGELRGGTVEDVYLNIHSDQTGRLKLAIVNSLF